MCGSQEIKASLLFETGCTVVPISWHISSLDLLMVSPDPDLGSVEFEFKYLSSWLVDSVCCHCRTAGVSTSAFKFKFKIVYCFLFTVLVIHTFNLFLKVNLTGMIMDLYTGIKGLIHYTHNFHACTIEFSCINSLRPGDAYVHWWAGSPLVKAMTCCLLAPSHHLYQSRPFSSVAIENFQFWYE